MPVKVTVEDIDHGLKAIMKQIRKLNGAHTDIGHFSAGGKVSDNIAALAYIMEHGARIRVTAKMRAFFSFKFNVRLKKRVIILPKRPFHKKTYDREAHNAQKYFEKQLSQIYSLKITAKKALSRLGEWYEGQMKETFISGNFVANSALTKKLKKSSKPLIDKGHLRGSTRHKESI